MYPEWGKREMCMGYWWERNQRPGCRWVDNIKMDLLEMGWGGVDWSGSG
jgi:hypothetical protein